MIEQEGVTSVNAGVVFTDLSQTITVGYSQTDSFNPYFMETDLNTDLISLVFEPLFNVDDTFCAQSDLAKSYSADGLSLTVKIDKSAAFSDGVQISSSDIIYSFNLAKNSKRYKSELLNINSASAADSETVTFFLAGKTPNPQDALIFPIVKSSSADTEGSVPIGTGLFKYNVSSDNKSLEYNVYCRKPEATIKAITLTDVPDSSTLIHTLELGTIDAYFDDLSSGSYSQANSANTKTNLPNLLFLGMNSLSYGLSSISVKQAIFSSVNRQSIVKNSFKNYAVESYTPFHPEWHVFTDANYDTSGFALDYSKAQELLKSAGFTEKLNYKMIVYSGNNFKVAAAREIADNLSNIGIIINISELTWDEYTLALTNGDYDMYLGEVKLSADMNLSSLFGDNSVVRGISHSDKTGNAYNEFADGNISVNAFTDSFLQNMPFVPVCFRMGAIVYSDKISPAADCDYLNVYKNIYEWNVVAASHSKEDNN